MALDQHISNTKQHIQINSFTLRFNEDCDEDVYKKYMGAELRYEWNLVAVIGIAFTALVQISMILHCLMQSSLLLLKKR